MQRQFTSVFSEYDCTQNTSINSKQLQYWLKQISSPSRAPNLGFEWTFMSNASSRFEFEQISFAKNTVSSQEPEKQNDPLTINKNEKEKKESKSKSYVNAMVALQKKVKTLEDENQFIKKNIIRVNEERNRSMSDSIAVEEELRSKLDILEPKTRKIDELIEQNKKIREIKDQKVRKLKIVEKNYQQTKSRYEQLQKNYENMKIHNEKLEQEKSAAVQKNEAQGQEIKKLLEKTKQLEQMREKSTLSILEKYQKSVELTEQLEKQNMKLKNEITSLKKNSQEQLKKKEQKYQNEINKCRIEFEKLKESFNLQESKIEEQRKQILYFRGAYEKKDEEYTILAKSQQKLEKLIQQSQVIQMPQTLVHIGEKKSFEGIDSENQAELQAELDQSIIPVPAETKSLGKPTKKTSNKKSVLSSSQIKKKSAQSKSKKRSGQISPKQQQKSQEKVFENNSFIMKSCEQPKKQYQFSATFEQSGRNDHKVVNKGFHSAPFPPPLPHSSFGYSSYVPQQIHEFYHRNCPQNSADQIMLIELQKQLLELYDQQQNLIMASNDEYATQADRAEYIGRLKQLNEHLSIKNQRICELKSRI